MDLSSIRVGMLVVIVASDDFYAYVNGWHGQAAGLQSGLVVVHAKNPDGQPVTLYVPPDQLGPLPAYPLM